MPATAEEQETRQDAGRQARVAVAVDFAAASKAVLANINDRRLSEPSPAPTPSLPAPPRSDFTDVEQPLLQDYHLSNCRVLPSREAILPLLPKGGVCAEFGTQSGHFAQLLLAVLQPPQLHLYSHDFRSFERALFQSAIDRGVVQLHPGSAEELLAGAPDGKFDVVHVHPDDSFAQTARSLALAARVVKDDGYILCANYTTYSPLEGIKCGVGRAVHEFCHQGRFEIVYLALHPLGCNDVVIRRRGRTRENEHLGGAFLNAPDANTYLPDVWTYLIDRYAVKSVLDVGAGVGWSTKWFADQGLLALGVEGWPEALEKSQCRDRIVAHDYTRGPFVPTMPFDLGWCAEFVEHIEEEHIPNFMASFQACSYVCMTHGEIGQIGYHHVNCQSTDYWIEKMGQYGFDYDAAETANLRATDTQKNPWGRKTLTFFRKRTQGNVERRTGEANSSQLPVNTPIRRENALRAADELFGPSAKRVPPPAIVPAPIFVRNGKILSTAGNSAGGQAETSAPKAAPNETSPAPSQANFKEMTPALDDPAMLEKQFELLGPWYTKFVLNGRAYGGKFSYDNDPRLRDFFEWCTEGETVLELGSFEGAHSFAVTSAPRIRKHLGLEGRQYLINRAEFMRKALGNDRVSFKQCNFEVDPITQYGLHDMIFCSGLLYHIGEPWKLVEQIARVTNRLFLSTHYAEKRLVQRDRYWGILWQEGTHADPLSGLVNKSFWPTFPHLVAMLTDYGFRVVHVRDYPEWTTAPLANLYCEKIGPRT
jgi:Methyltransferase domain